MRPQYDIVLESYMSSMESFAIAIEANDIEKSETVKTKEDIEKTTKHPTSSKVGDFISKLCDKIISAIKIGIAKIQNRLTMIWQTDKGFKKELRKRQISVKPPDGLTITTYQYNSTYLESMINRLNQFYSRAMTQLYSNTKNANSVIEGQSSITKTLLRAIGGQDFNSINEFLTHMKEKFRGEKKTFKYMSSQLNNIIAAAENTGGLARNMTKMKTDTNIAIKRIKGEVDRFKAKNMNEDAEKVKKNLSIANELTAAYIAIQSYYTELTIERNMSYRIILKKFYQF